MVLCYACVDFGLVIFMGFGRKILKKLDEEGEISRIIEVEHWFFPHLHNWNDFDILPVTTNTLHWSLWSQVLSLPCKDLQLIWHCWHCIDSHIVLHCNVLDSCNTYMYGIIVCFELLSWLSYCVCIKFQIIWGTQIFILVWKH